MLRLLRSLDKNESPICEEGKEMHADFAVDPQTAKVTAAVHDKWEVGKPLNLCFE